MHYDWVPQLLFASPLTLNFSNTPDMSFLEWLVTSIKTWKSDTFSLIVAIIYYLWSARNNFVFNHVSIHVSTLICNATADVSNFLLNNSTNRRMDEPGMSCRNNDWSPPVMDCLKLNVDAHSMSDGRWGLGFILRRSDGSPVVVRTKVVLSSEDVSLAEALGIKEAIWCIKEKKTLATSRWNQKQRILLKLSMEPDQKTYVIEV